MFDLNDLDGDYFEIQRVLEFLFRYESVRCVVYVEPQIGSIGFTVNADDFITERGDITPEKTAYFLIYKRDFYLFTPLLFRQETIDRIKFTFVKDMFKGRVKTSTRIQGILTLKDVSVRGITQLFHRDFREKRIRANSTPGIMIKVKTGNTIPEFSELTQIEITFGDYSRHIVNPSLT